MSLDTVASSDRQWLHGGGVAITGLGKGVVFNNDCGGAGARGIGKGPVDLGGGLGRGLMWSLLRRRLSATPIATCEEVECRCGEATVAVASGWRPYLIEIYVSGNHT
ncbi:unnamed protein product [Cuscuta epithymum]|uniref:Uncharacterized protein n=1 Tax=Cuscuta epithymum TaxID=186058 RepID=A0AAV0CN94_9ASTE|nr:unnamed protein product [Cuscuta epithymum]